MMDLGWTPSPPQSFKRPTSATDTLTRLASFIARAESKPGLSRSHRPPQAPQPAPNLPYTCAHCGQTFPYATELLSHQDSEHALPKPHRCPRCLQEFSLKSSLEFHKCESPSIISFHASSSPNYAQLFTNIEEISKDDGTCNAEVNPFTSVPCGQTVCETPALQLHPQADNGTAQTPPFFDIPKSPLSNDDDSTSSTSLFAPDGESVCTFCSKTFTNDAAFQRHTKLKRCDRRESESSNEEESKTTAKARGLFRCRSCDKVFSSTAKLHLHRKDSHSRGVKYIIEPNPVTKRHRKPSNSTYTCQICSKVFFHHLSLWAHSKKHPTNANGKFTKTNTAHKETPKLIEKPEKKVAPIKITLRKNVWTQEVSIDKEELPKLHRKTKSKVPKKAEEEEEEEYLCPSCPQVFSHFSDLKLHSELHQTSARRGNCSVCACDMDSSKREAASKRHRLYHCALCQSGFSTLDMFLSHCQEHLKTRVEEERGVASVSELQTEQSLQLAPHTPGE